MMDTEGTPDTLGMMDTPDTPDTPDIPGMTDTGGASQKAVVTGFPRGV